MQLRKIFSVFFPSTLAEEVKRDLERLERSLVVRELAMIDHNYQKKIIQDQIIYLKKIVEI